MASTILTSCSSAKNDFNSDNQVTFSGSTLSVEYRVADESSVAQDVINSVADLGASAVRTLIAITRVTFGNTGVTGDVMNGSSVAQDAIINPVADSNWSIGGTGDFIAITRVTFFDQYAV